MKYLVVTFLLSALMLGACDFTETETRPTSARVDNKSAAQSATDNGQTNMVLPKSSKFTGKSLP